MTRPLTFLDGAILGLALAVLLCAPSIIGAW
jgi:hypothetical protein